MVFNSQAFADSDSVWLYCLICACLKKSCCNYALCDTLDLPAPLLAILYAVA